jgi:pilus assembly protein Flp/PilA
MDDQGHGRGQGLVEYAIILLLVALIVIATFYVLGPQIGNMFSSAASSFP